jgi:hypothetical protein
MISWLAFVNSSTKSYHAFRLLGGERIVWYPHECVSKNFRTGRSERECRWYTCYFVSQSSEFCYHNPLCCFLTSVCCWCCCCLFRYDSVRKLLDTPTGWTIGVVGFDSRRGLGISLFTTASKTALWPIQPPNQGLPGTLSFGVNRPGREADHSLPSSVKVKEWVELYLHFPNMPSWRGVELSTGRILRLILNVRSLYMIPEL